MQWGTPFLRGLHAHEAIDAYEATDLNLTGADTSRGTIKLATEARAIQTAIEYKTILKGDSVDLRGFRLRRRFVCDRDGNPLTFQLHIAWVRERILSPAAYRLADDLARHMANGDGEPELT